MNLKIVEQCQGCSRVVNGNCKVYSVPALRWKNNNICPMATHLQKQKETAQKINPLKAAKRANKRS